MGSIFGDDDGGPMPPMPKIEMAPPPTLEPGKRPGRKNPRLTFLGSEMTPGPASANFGGKTLLGQ